MKIPYEIVALIILEVIRSWRHANSGEPVTDEALKLESFSATERRVLDRLTEMGYEVERKQ